MLATFEVISLFLSAVTMSTSLAHALEFPGKMGLDQSTYLAVQTIYYPGFAFAGIAEPNLTASTKGALRLDESCRSRRFN